MRCLRFLPTAKRDVKRIQLVNVKKKVTPSTQRNRQEKVESTCWWWWWQTFWRPLSTVIAPWPIQTNKPHKNQ